MINKSIKYSPKLKALGFLGKSSFVLFCFFPILKPKKHSLFFPTPKICISEGMCVSPQPVKKSKSPTTKLEGSEFGGSGSEDQCVQSIVGCTCAGVPERRPPHYGENITTPRLCP